MQKSINFWSAILFTSILLTVGIMVLPALASQNPPTPTSSYYGDANGDGIISAPDLIEHQKFVINLPATYTTLQPQSPGQYWNTCDINSDRVCDGSDLMLTQSLLLGGAVNITDKPWVLENNNLTLSGNTANEWHSFTVNLKALNSVLGWSGRPGISVVAEIDQSGSVGTGKLRGRSCNPDPTGPRDQAAPAGAQCALAVTVTDWNAAPDHGDTEDGAYSLAVWGDGNGPLRLNIHITANPSLDIPAVSMTLDVDFLPAASQTNTAPPSPTSHFYGDADGDAEFTGADYMEHLKYIFSMNAAYSTLQPQTPSQFWNTCDLNSDRNCDGMDILLMQARLLGGSISVADKPWTLENNNLPLSGNPTNAWAPFTVNLKSLHPTLGASGRPGISVVAQIDQANSTVAGKLKGRNCAPDPAGGRNQAAPAGAQCALAVTLTDWNAAPDHGDTESGQYSLAVWADGDGSIRLNISVQGDPSLDIPSVTLPLDVSFGNVAPTITSTPPSTAMEDFTYVYDGEMTDPDGTGEFWMLTASDTCGGSIDSATGVYTLLPLECEGGTTCQFDVCVDDGEGGVDFQSATITIASDNAAPVITTSPSVLSVKEGSLYSYDANGSDADCADTLTWSVSTTDSCGGTIDGATGLYTFTPPPGSYGSNCVMAIGLSDGHIMVTQSAAIDILNPSTYSAAKRFGGVYYDSLDGIATDPMGNVYIIGSFYGAANFAEDFGGTDSKSSAGLFDVYMTKINVDGTYAWTRRVGGPNTEMANDIVVNNIGNVVMTGSFYDSSEFASDFGGNDQKTSAGSYDIFATIVNADGSYGGTYRIGGPELDRAYGAIFDSAGNFYMVGEFRNTVNFAADWGQTESGTSLGQNDAFVMKVNNDATFAWAKRLGGSGADVAMDVDADQAGNIYVTGYFEGTVNFAYDWGQNDIKTAAGGYDVFVTRINADGAYGWTKVMGGTDWDYGTAVAVGPGGELLVSGYFQDSVDFALDWGASDAKTSAGGNDVFITRIEPDGSYGWTHAFGGTGWEFSRGVVVGDAGNVYVAGEFSDSVDFALDWGASDLKTSAGQSDIFLTRLNPEGTYGWTRRMGGSGADSGKGIAKCPGGNVCVAGDFELSVNFAEDWLQNDVKTSVGDRDAFVTAVSNAN